MHFTHPDIESSLLAELFSQRVISQADWGALIKPEEGCLTDVLRKNANKLDADAWAYWLMKRHDFTRIPRLQCEHLWYEKLRWPVALERKAAFFGCYPLKVCHSTAYFVSLRPDVKKGIDTFLEWLGVRRAQFFALVPSELDRWETLPRNPA